MASMSFSGVTVPSMTRWNQSVTMVKRQVLRTDCGRDGPFGPPPAQIRTCSITAYGSYRWCLASKRAQGYGCVIAGRGIHRLMSTLNRCQFVVLL